MPWGTELRVTLFNNDHHRDENRGVPLYRRTQGLTPTFRDNFVVRGRGTETHNRTDLWLDIWMDATNDQVRRFGTARITYVITR